MNHSIVCGDTLPHLSAVLTQAGAPIDLTNCTVRFEMKPFAGGDVLGGACVVDSATDGRIHYEWKTVDTATIGSYHGQFHITYGNGDTLTVPTTGVVSVAVGPRIGT